MQSQEKNVRWLDEFTGSNYYTQINKIKLHLGKKKKQQQQQQQQQCGSIVWDLIIGLAYWLRGIV